MQSSCYSNLTMRTRTASQLSICHLLMCATSAARVFRMNKDGQVQLANGTVALPALSFESDKDCGIYRIGANNIGVAVNGAKVLDIGTAGLGITGTMISSGAALPSANDGAALGASGTAWADLFLASGAVINFNAGNATITHSAGALNIGVTSILPAVDNTTNLGSSAKGWSAVHITPGGSLGIGLAGLISFDGGDVTITHSANVITVAGGSLVTSGALTMDGALDHNGTTVGFYGAVPTTQLTGVAVSAAGIHAALVTLGLITA